MKTKNKTKLKKFIIKIAISLILLVLFLKWIDVSTAFQYITLIDPGYFLLACVCVALVQVIRSYRFYFLTLQQGMHLGKVYNFAVHFVSAITGYITPFRLGEGGKILFYKQRRKTLSYLFIVEKMADTAILFLTAIIGFIYFQNVFLDKTEVLLSLVIFFLIGIVVLLLIINIEKVMKRLFKIDMGDKWFIEQSKTFFKSISNNLILLVSTVAIWLVMALFHFLFLLSLGVEIDFWAVLAIMTLSLVVGLATGIPGGIGPKEITFTFLMSTIYGVDKSLVGIASLITTLGLLLTLTLLSIPSIYIVRNKKITKIKKEK